MRRFSVACLSVLLVWSCYASRVQPNSPPDGLGIVGRGLLQSSNSAPVVAPPGRFPYIASIRESRDRSHLCVGTVISPEWVVTIVECVKFLRGLPVVYIGLVDPINDELPDNQIFLAKSIIPSLTNITDVPDSSIALIQLEIPVTNIMLPRIPTTNVETDEFLRLLGFGVDEILLGGELFGDLRIELHTVTNFQFCNETFEGVYEKGDFCSMRKSRPGASCVGETGSPLIRMDRPKDIANGRPDFDQIEGILAKADSCDKTEEFRGSEFYRGMKAESEKGPLQGVLEEIKNKGNGGEGGSGQNSTNISSILVGVLVPFFGLVVFIIIAIQIKRKWKIWFPPPPFTGPRVYVYEELPYEPGELKAVKHPVAEASESPFLNAQPPEKHSVSFPILKRNLILYRKSEIPLTIGSGHFATVEKGCFISKKDERHDVAVKIPKPEVEDSEIDAFRNEIEMFEKVPIHKNIVKCFGGNLGEEGNAEGHQQIFIVEEFMDTNLRKVIHGEYSPSPWTYTMVLEIFREINCGLQHLHEYKVIHHDLKPDNILVNLITQPVPQSPQSDITTLSSPPHTWIIKLADFGCSRSKAKTYMTAQFAGTLAYMAPEILWSSYFGGFKVNSKIDLYSLGVIMWEILTGNDPSTSVSIQQGGGLAGSYDSESIGASSLVAPPDSRFPIGQHHPGDLRDLIWRCLEFGHEKRPSCEEITEKIKIMENQVWSGHVVERERSGV